MTKRRTIAVGVTLGAVALMFAVALGIGRLGDRDSSPDTGTTNPNTGFDPSSQYFEVQPRSFPVTVLASGELEAKRVVEIKCQVDGDTTITEVIEEGTPVAEGDVLMRLADDAISEKIEQEELQVEQARAEHVAAEQQLAIQDSQSTSRRGAAELARDLARLDLARWEQGVDPQRVRELRLLLEKAKRNVVRSERDLELSRQLYQEKFISLGELEDDEIAVIDAENTLATAELDIQVYDDYTRPMEHRRVQSALEQAQAELDRTIQSNQSEVAQARAQLQSKQRALSIRQTKLEKLREQLANTVVRAPQAGIVVYATSIGPHWRRDSPITTGRQVKFNETMLILPDTRQMVAALKVHESMLPQVAAAQRVEVNIDARPGTAVQGVVSQIGVMAEDGGWLNPELREYVVRVDLPPDFDPSLKPAMRCSGRIMVDHARDVLAVPIQAVRSKGVERYCYVASSNGRRVRKQIIRIGRTGESLVEVIDGLSSGARVLLREPKPGEVDRS